MPARRWVLVLLLSWLLGLGAVAAAAERVILEKQSPYSTIVVSEDEAGLRILRFGHNGARQSVVKPGDPEHLELRYLRVMIPLAFLFVEQPRSALVIGLGGGSIPSFLRKRFPQMQIDVVDIDPDVVEVARSHFGFREDARMRVHVQDGRRFVEQTSERYDLVFLDGFGADNVPPHLTTREFLAAVRAILTAQGAVIGNIWSRPVNRLYDSMVKTYRAAYDGLLVADVEGTGNKILVATAKRRDLPRDELIERAERVSRELQLRHGITGVVEHNLRLRGEDGASGKLLIDAELGAALAY
jgi:spermidine synthase